MDAASQVLSGKFEIAENRWTWPAGESISVQRGLRFNIEVTQT
ncbi:MAG: hypothetical protein ACI9HK_001475 [Pirellulaceae bacterium]|jgi:hypothetical protein